MSNSMVEQMRLFVRLFLGLSGLLLCHAWPSAALADEPKVIVGKDNWLFFSQEVVGPDEQRDIDTSIDLIGRLNSLLQANGVQMVYALVPAKMRVYAEFLPDQWKMQEPMQGNYDRILAKLKSRKVSVVDINAALKQSPLRKTSSPVFMKGDTHWAPIGALVAAEAISRSILDSPALNAAFQSTPAEKYVMEFQKRLTTLPPGDLAVKIAGAAALPPEQSLLFDVTRVAAAGNGAGANASPMIALGGSSYSADWTMFADALRFALQRDILAMSATEAKGPWVGLIEPFVSSDKFQLDPPRLFIWEAVEQELVAPPSFAYRDKQFVSDNGDWLLRVSAWIQRTCKPSTVRTSIAKTGLASAAGAVTADSISANATTQADFIEFDFEPPATSLDYVSARMTAPGAKGMALEVIGAGGQTRRISVNPSGDARDHVFRAALPAGGGPWSKVRLYPGKTDKFSLSQIAVCAQPGDLLN